MEFIDPPAPPPSPIRKFKMTSSRPLWQETNYDCGYSADDEEMKDGDNNNNIKRRTLSADDICKTLGLKCTSKNGICRECKLSRKYAKMYRSEVNQCSQQ